VASHDVLAHRIPSVPDFSCSGRATGIDRPAGTGTTEVGAALELATNIVRGQLAHPCTDICGVARRNWSARARVFVPSSTGREVGVQSGVFSHPPRLSRCSGHGTIMSGPYGARVGLAGAAGLGEIHMHGSGPTTRPAAQRICTLPGARSGAGAGRGHHKIAGFARPANSGHRQ